MGNGSTVDQGKLNEFLGQFVNDLGAGFHLSTVLVGDKLGLYKALASSGPMSSEELAQATQTNERYVREWLAAQAAANYVLYNPKSHKFHMSAEQAFTLADENSPAYLPGAFLLVQSLFKDEPRIVEAFRSGKGMGWHEHSPEPFEGTNRFFRPGYVANLTSSWLPALHGVVAKLEAGATVADVGCGLGSSTILTASTYPKSKVVGFDYHEPSLVAARTAAKAAGVGDRVRFEKSTAKEYPGKDYDLITFFDCLHDMGDPLGAAKHARSAIAPDGTWMVVEPFANEELAGNLNPVGRVYYAASAMICTPASRDQEVGAAWGAQTPDSMIHSAMKEAGFTRFRRATVTPFNRIFEIRP